MAAAPLELYVEKGATLRQSLVLRSGPSKAELAPIDLTLWAARAQVRETLDSDPLLTFDSTPIAGEHPITLDAAGHVVLTCPAAATSAVVPARGVWALEMTSPDGNVDRWLEGPVVFSPEVTR